MGAFFSQPYEITCTPKWANSFVVETHDEQSLREAIDSSNHLGNDKLWYFEINGTSVKELPADYFSSALTVALTKMSPPNTHVVNSTMEPPPFTEKSALIDPR